MATSSSPPPPPRPPSHQNPPRPPPHHYQQHPPPPSPSPSTPYTPPSKHEVFISFQVKDVDKDFLSLVKEAFKNKSLNVYVDETEPLRRDHKHFFKRIEQSIVALVIFSNRYARSEQCLDELVKINERMVESKLKVMAIYYKVDVANVRTRAGKFGFNFMETLRGYGCRPFLRIKNWVEALESIPQKFGLSSFDYRCENDFANANVEEVEKMLNNITKEADAA